MPVILIAALSKNRCIGREGKVPWNLPDDLRHFRELTMGHTVVMGRKTWESIPEKFRPLPGRKNAVLTRKFGYRLPEGVERFLTLSDALKGRGDETVYIIGGAEIYAQALSIANRLELTLIDETIDGDAYFPDYLSEKVWKERKREDHPGYSFVTYERT